MTKDKIAKNLLEDKTCRVCIFSWEETCQREVDESVEVFDLYSVKSTAINNTCENWKTSLYESE